MYINDVHIFIYIAFFIVGAVVGQFIEWVNKRVIENKKIFSKDIKLELKRKMKINYFTVLSTAILYVIILFKFGIKTNLLDNLELIKFIILMPILISIMIIDFRKKIIPNRLTLTIFESGIIFTFLYGLNNLFMVKDYLLGAIIGTILFGVIAILGRLIAGKEAMGMGDVKLISAIGLYFGTSLTISISIISFIIASILGIISLIPKSKRNNEYITFGPCIGISAIICIIFPQEAVISVLLTVFTLGKYRG